MKENTLPFLRAFPEFSQVKAGFSLRIGGQSTGPYESLNLSLAQGDSLTNVQTNWISLLGGESLHLKNLCILKQIHSNQIIQAKTWDWQNPPEGDALWSVKSKQFLAALGADCLPILLFCTEPKIIAAVHAGWRGTQQKILIKLLETLSSKADLQPENTHLSFGPCLQPCHFEVGNEFRQLFPEEVLSYRSGQLYLDNQLANFNQALEFGIPQKNIFRFPHCTYCHPSLFFSHRRDKVPTGRTAGWITLV